MMRAAQKNARPDPPNLVISPRPAPPFSPIILHPTANAERFFTIARKYLDTEDVAGYNRNDLIEKGELLW